ncbi:MAG: PIN domain-containing protein [Actinomycetota bacterium]|nr:PIN domain-containing protein [Actinomycetota bacterium]
MIAEKAYVDGGILVYAYDIDSGTKHDQAKKLLLELWDGGAVAVSTQVLQEFYVTVTRKLSKPLGRRVAREVVATYDAWEVFRPGAADIIAASEMEERHRLSFWDALIIIAANQCGATNLLSEDLQHGMVVEKVTISNPLLAG